MLQALHNRKAADQFNIAEHLKLASPVLNKVLTLLTNNILSKTEVPDELKLGVITPCSKKSKPKKNPDNYRRITVNSIIGKVVVKESLLRLKETTLLMQNRYQFGFT